MPARAAYTVAPHPSAARAASTTPTQSIAPPSNEPEPDRTTVTTRWLTAKACATASAPWATPTAPRPAIVGRASGMTRKTRGSKGFMAG